MTDRRLVFAHRGGARLAPENTMAAIDNGIALGADGLEIDVQLSSDGVPVVIHDRTLDRTTDRVGPVKALSASELARVDAGFHFAGAASPRTDGRGRRGFASPAAALSGPASGGAGRLEGPLQDLTPLRGIQPIKTPDGVFPFRGQGIGVPTLDAVLARHPDTRVIIEMKGDEPELARAVGAAVRRADAVQRTCVGSFYQRSIDTLRAEHPAIMTSASEEEARWMLHRSWIRWPFRRERVYSAFQVPERSGRMRVVSPNFVRHVHREGHVVQVWVVNEPADIRRLLDWGVDGIISDVPDLAIATRDAWASTHR